VQQLPEISYIGFDLPFFVHFEFVVYKHFSTFVYRGFGSRPLVTAFAVIHAAHVPMALPTINHSSLFLAPSAFARTDLACSSARECPASPASLVAIGCLEGIFL
jgi:hypothetical protein